MTAVNEERKLSLNELEDIKQKTYDNTHFSKERAKFFHDKRINKKQFSLGQKMLLYDSRLHLFPGKLRSRWVGPYEVVRVFSHGVVEIRGPTKTKFLR